MKNKKAHIFATVLLTSLVLVANAQAQFGKLLDNIKNNPLVAQQGNIQNIISKAQAISSAFSQMPLNSGKLEFIKAALPLLTQVDSLSTGWLKLSGQGKAPDAASMTKAGGLLDKVKALIAQQWSTTPLTPAQTSVAAGQVQQFTTLLANILKDQGGILKGLTGIPVGK